MPVVSSFEEDQQERRKTSDRRVGAPDRRSGIPRRVRNKFVLFNRRSGTGRRLLVKGRRYIPERRQAQVA